MRFLSRSSLARLVSRHAQNKGTKAPQLCFDRWLCRVSITKASVSDPKFPHYLILPERSLPPDAGIVTDLSRNMSAATAQLVAANLAAASDKALSKLCQKPPSIKKLRKQLRSEAKELWELCKAAAKKESGVEDFSAVAAAVHKVQSSATEGLHTLRANQHRKTSGTSAQVTASFSRRAGFVDLSIEAMRPYLTISVPHFNKMKRLYIRHSDKKSLATSDGGESAQMTKQSFLDALYCVLARYEAIRGVGTCACGRVRVGECIGVGL